jgi:CcmD family protein
MHLSYLFAAFLVVWLGVLLYVVTLARRHRELEHDLEDLRAILEQRRRDDPPAS